MRAQLCMNSVREMLFHSRINQCRWKYIHIAFLSSSLKLVFGRNYGFEIETHQQSQQKKVQTEPSGDLILCTLRFNVHSSQFLLVVRLLSTRENEVLFQKRVRGFITVSKHEKTDRARGRKPSVFTVFDCVWKPWWNHMHVTELACLGWMITLWIINEFEEKQSNVESFLSVPF